MSHELTKNASIADVPILPPLIKADARTPDWTTLRNRWELSHLLRAGLGLLALTLLAAAVAL